MKRIACIINPQAGNARKSFKAADLDPWVSHPDLDLTLFIKSPEQSLTDLAQDIVKDRYDAVVAAGGDGTVNALAQALMGTQTALVVLPLGSGNGFARHHHIPLPIQDALQQLTHHKETFIDCGMLGTHLFVNVAGLGFDAKISHAFKDKKQRGLLGYTQTVLKEWDLKSEHYLIESEENSWQGDAWMMSICNGSQWGNNFRLFPSAKTDDGILHAVVFKKSPIWQIPSLGLHFLTNQLPKHPSIQVLHGPSFKVTPNQKIALHVDGEPCGFTNETIEIKVIPKCLKLWKAD